MNGGLMTLYITAASIGFLHTLFGPDHYLPFLVMGRARKWSLRKTCLITFLCGLGHVASSIILGVVGIFLGIGVMKLEALEAVRGNLAGWVLIGFGLTYSIWSLRRMLKNRPHEHSHAHGGSTDHEHLHDHTDEHTHIHQREGGTNITPWILFTIFILGPCEPLIPVLMYPAAKMSVVGIVGVAIIFSVTTIATMLGVVIISSWGINLIPLGRLERYAHLLAGATICLCGVAIQFLGL